MNPKVSIIVPIYNVSRFIERCARSLFEQTFKSIEYIFINDCTPDDSIIILNKIILDYPQISNKVRIIEHKTNRGLAAARNSGLLAAQGEYIQHIDSDDFIELDMIELLYNKAIDDKADIVVTDFIFDWGKVNQSLIQTFSPNPVEFTNLLISGEVLPGVVNKMIKKTLYIDNQILSIEGINNGEDFVTTPRLSYFAKRISKVNKPLYHYSQENENAYTKLWSKGSVENLIAVLNILNDFFKLKPDYEKYKLSLLQGQLRKKISLYISSDSAYWNLFSNSFIESNSVYAFTSLTKIEKSIYWLSNKKSSIYLIIFLFLHSNALELLQILKGRR